MGAMAKTPETQVIEALKRMARPDCKGFMRVI